jgi:hypothetical protein
MGPDRFFDCAEFAGYLLAQTPGDDQRHNLPFARRQPLEAPAQRIRFAAASVCQSGALERKFDRSKSTSRTGFGRKSEAPAFIAATVIAMSPYPVMKMIGNASRSFRCN